MTDGDTLYDQEPIISYQYNSNSEYGVQNAIRYDVCLKLIDRNSQFQCWDTVCIDPGLYVAYFKSLSVPNALAPGGISGEPAIFLPKGKSLEKYTLQIFDSWGNLVWETIDELDNTGKPTVGWDGTTLNGKICPEGTYIWKINFGEKSSDKKYKFDGHVTVLK